MENLTPDGKIKTIRCVTATHEDFAKLVNLGKAVQTELAESIAAHGDTEALLEKLKAASDVEREALVSAYTYQVQKAAELEAYKNAYHVLMEEGVDELLTTIHIAPESYDYDFYTLCLEN